MDQPVKSPRRYDNTRRTEQATITRRRILDAAGELIASQGYVRTTVAQIAASAGVNADTVYSVVGRKADVMAELVETAISGQDVAVPADEREYVKRIEASTDAHTKLAIYAEANARIQERLAPLFMALRDAASTDEACRVLWKRISERRAANMLRFAGSLRSTGELRDDLTDDQVADVIWSMNAPEYWGLLVTERHWSPEQFAAWLIDAWERLLLRP